MRKTTILTWLLATTITAASGCSSGAPRDDASAASDESPLAATFSGWSEVPGGGTTLVSDAAVTYNGKLYLFGIGIGDHGHYVNVFDGARWSGWSAVPGGGTTLVSDAAVAYNGKLYLFGIGIGDHGHYVNVFDGAAWSGWSAVPGGGTTLVSDAAVAYDGKLYLFGIGIGDHRHYVNVFDGASWSGWSALPIGGTTLVSDAAVAHNGKLYLFGIGTNDHRHYVTTFDGRSWSGWSAVPGNGTTMLPDAAVSYGGKLFLFGIGIGDHKHYVNVLDGASWSGWSAVPGNGTTSVADAAAEYNGKLYLFGIGTNDHRHYVNVGSVGNAAPNANPLFFPVGPSPQVANWLGPPVGVSGRVCSIAISPSYDGRGTPAMYVSNAGGGVWRSTDFTAASPTWKPLLDKLPGASVKDKVGLSNVCALAVDPNNHRVLYAGSGDPSGPGANVYGAGILKSTDGGDHWSLIATNDFASKPGITRIFVDPYDYSGNTVYATGAFAKNSPFRGVYKSTDAGASWQRVDGFPDNVAVTDLDYRYNAGHVTLYAGVVDLNGGDAPASGVWTSTDGAPFTQLGLTLTDTNGLLQPRSKISDIKLAADHTLGGASGVLAAVGGANTLINVLKLDGTTFHAAGPPALSGLRQINITSALAIAMAPDGTAYVGGVNDARQNGLYESVDGGAHWFSIDVGSNNLRPHTDQHAWAFYKGLVYNGNDGGIWRYTPNGTSRGPWESLNTGSLQTILVNGIGVHPTNGGVMLVGSQDNTLALRTSGVWNTVNGAVSGDASRARFDPNNGSYAYTTGVSDYHFFSRSDDGGKTWKDKSPGGSPNVPDYAVFGFNPSNTARVVLGLDMVYETRDRGDHWSVVSGVLGSGSVTAIASAGADTIWAAYGPRIFLTTDDGAHWVEKNGSTDFGGDVADIAIDPRNPSGAYISIATGHVWHTADAGATWEELTGDFPGIPMRTLAVYPYGASDAALFVATSVGVYAALKVAGGQTHWAPYGQNLPDAQVNDLQLSPNGQLTIGTWGRGVYLTTIR